MNVEIKQIRKCSAGNLKAFIDVELNDIVMRDFRLIKENGKRAWVSMPVTSYLDDGILKYKTLIELQEEDKAQVFSEIIKAFN